MLVACVLSVYHMTDTSFTSLTDDNKTNIWKINQPYIVIMPLLPAHSSGLLHDSFTPYVTTLYGKLYCRKGTTMKKLYFSSNTKIGGADAFLEDAYSLYQNTYRSLS